MPVIRKSTESTFFTCCVWRNKTFLCTCIVLPRIAFNLNLNSLVQWKLCPIMHCTNFSEKWRRHMNLFTKFVNIFLVINVKHYFFVSDVIILDYRINVHIRKRYVYCYRSIRFICMYLRMTTQHDNTQDLYYRLYYTCFYSPLNK